VFTAIERGELALRVDHVFPLAEAGAAHRALESRATTGKLILTTTSLASNSRE
jgi:NADPH:quinone reductase